MKCSGFGEDAGVLEGGCSGSPTNGVNGTPGRAVAAIRVLRESRNLFGEPYLRRPLGFTS